MAMPIDRQLQKDTAAVLAPFMKSGGEQELMIDALLDSGVVYRRLARKNIPRQEAQQAIRDSGFRHAPRKTRSGKIIPAEDCMVHKDHMAAYQAKHASEVNLQRGKAEVGSCNRLRYAYRVEDGISKSYVIVELAANDE
jgi:hypothetical protein